MLLRPLLAYGTYIALGSVKPTEINRVQTYQSKSLRQISKALYNTFLITPYIIHTIYYRRG